MSNFIGQNFGVVVGLITPITGRLVADADEIPAKLDFELLTGSVDRVINITLTNADGTAANLDGEVLSVVIESHDRSDVEIVADDDIERAANVITFSIPAAMLTIARTLRWSLRASGGGILAGRIVVKYAATVDPTP